MPDQDQDQTEELPLLLEQDWHIVEALLPEGWMAKARELGALQRTRGFADARVLLQVLLIHLADRCGLRETAARAALAGLANVSDVALLKRLRSCGPWFEWMGQQLRALTQCESAAPLGDGLGALLGDRRVRVVDGSVVSEPGVTGSHWRLHYAIGLPRLDCQEVLVSPSDDGETLKRFEVRRGDVFVADRGYAHPGGVAHVKDSGGDVVVRMNLVTLPLVDPATGEKLDVLKCVRQLQVGEAGQWPARLKVKAEGGRPARQIAGRLCASRKSAAAAADSRSRVRRESSHGRTRVQPQTLEAAEYVLVFTTLEANVTAQQVMELYRLRWQIELQFKHLKSLLQLGHLKKRDALSARSWLQGKLMVAFLLARLIAHAERVSPWGYDFEWFDHPARALSVA